jgi:hypothetical protein
MDQGPIRASAGTEPSNGSRVDISASRVFRLLGFDDQPLALFAHDRVLAGKLELARDLAGGSSIRSLTRILLSIENRAN